MQRREGNRSSAPFAITGARLSLLLPPACLLNNHGDSTTTKQTNRGGWSDLVGRKKQRKGNTPRGGAQNHLAAELGLGETKKENKAHLAVECREERAIDRQRPLQSQEPAFLRKRKGRVLPCWVGGVGLPRTTQRKRKRRVKGASAVGAACRLGGGGLACHARRREKGRGASSFLVNQKKGGVGCG
jgi:hypothetical protein